MSKINKEKLNHSGLGKIPSFSKLLITAVLFLMFITPTLAGAGRINYWSSPTIQRPEPYYPNQQANISATVNKSTGGWSIGEKFEVVIENPRPGDSCVLNSDTTNEYGGLSGYCTATSVGQVTSHLHSLISDDNSGSIVIYFVEPTQAPAQNTATPMPNVTYTPNYTITVNNSPIKNKSNPSTGSVKNNITAHPTQILTNTPSPKPTNTPIAPTVKQQDKFLGINKTLIYVLFIILLGILAIIMMIVINHVLLGKRKLQNQELGKETQTENPNTQDLDNTPDIAA